LTDIYEYRKFTIQDKKETLNIVESKPWHGLGGLAGWLNARF
jgi:hypothetical protein